MPIREASMILEPFEPCPEDEPCDIGVLNDGHDAVTIEGGTIRDFGLGVVVVRAKRNRLRDVAAVDNAFEGIVIFRSERTRVHGSSASQNGVGNSRPGIALAESDNNRITGNTMSRNGDLALFMEASDHNLIRHNKARGNPEDGMIIEGNRNLVIGSGRAGIIVGSRSTTITNNRAVRNAGLGIRAVKG